MSQSILNTLEIKTFEQKVHHQFIESGGTLRPTVRTVMIAGKDHQFPVYGSVSATVRSLGTDVVASNPSATAVTVTIVEYEAGIFTDIFLQSEVNYDALGELVFPLVSAAGRKEDQIIIDALDAESYSKTVAKDITGSDDNLTVAALADASRQLNLDGVPMQDRHWIASASGIAHLSQESDVKTADSNTVRTLVDGTVKTFYGFEFSMIGNNGDEDGLPLSTNDRTAWAYHKSAIGLAINKAPRVEVNYIPHKGAHLSTIFFSQAAKVIDASGIVEITTDES